MNLPLILMEIGDQVASQALPVEDQEHREIRVAFVNHYCGCRQHGLQILKDGGMALSSKETFDSDLNTFNVSRQIQLPIKELVCTITSEGFALRILVAAGTHSCAHKLQRAIKGFNHRNYLCNVHFTQISHHSPHVVAGANGYLHVIMKFIFFKRYRSLLGLVAVCLNSGFQFCFN